MVIANSVPTAAIEKLWTSFELNADGWGLSNMQFAQICSVLADDLCLGGTDEMDAKSNALFVLLDTDTNDMIDSLEFLATVSCLAISRPRRCDSRPLSSRPVPYAIHPIVCGCGHDGTEIESVNAYIGTRVGIALSPSGSP